MSTVLRNEDVNKTDMQNWSSCQRTFFPNVRECLWKMVHGLDGTTQNEQALGLWVYLDLLYDYLEIFVSLRASYYQRVVNAGYVTTFLGIWRNSIIMSDDLTLSKHFLSRETFQDLLLSCHFAVILIADFGLNYPYLECPLDRTGEDGCEVYFSMNGSWVKNHHAYTALDMVRNYGDMTRIAEINSTNEKVKFRRTNYKQDNIWEKQYEPGNRERTCNLKEYPTAAEIIEAWREGVSKARRMARMVGMLGKDNGSTEADDIPTWFETPFKDLSYLDLFQGLTSEENMQSGQSNEVEADSEWGELEDQNGAIFADCQNLMNEALAQEVGEEEGHGSGIDCRKHDSEIFVPEVNGVMPKSTVIKQLAKNKKVSADRLTRVRQASEQQQQDVEQDTGDDRDVFGLWDDIAFESDSHHGNTLPYRLGQVSRMRFSASGRRRLEYVRQVSLKKDSEKNIEILILPYNQSNGLYKRDSSTETVNISDVITAVNLVKEREGFRLSLADSAFLEAYFPQESSVAADHATQYLADDGRRVHLRRSRNGRVRRAIVYPR